jgi:hypothetical protein
MWCGVLHIADIARRRVCEHVRQKIIIIVETSSIAIGDPFFDDSVPRCERILRGRTGSCRPQNRGVRQARSRPALNHIQSF